MKTRFAISALVALSCVVQNPNWFDVNAQDGPTQTGATARVPASYWAAPGTGTITAAYQAATAVTPGGRFTIRIACGSYADNIDITTSNTRFLGENYNCITISPNDTSKPVIYFDGTGAGTSGLNFDEVSNVSLSCPPNTSCADAVEVNGMTTVDQPNDWIKMDRVYIVSMATNSAGKYGFLNGLDILNRTIWSEFTNLWIRGSRNNNVNIVPASGTMPDHYASTNDVHFIKLASSGAYNYGFYLASKNTVNPPEGYGIHDSNIEYNGNNASLANCAGLLIDGTFQVEVGNTTFENNCPKNTADSKSADIRASGMYNEALNIHGNEFNQSASEWAFYNDTTLTTGDFTANNLPASSSRSAFIATRSPASNFDFGCNNWQSLPSIIIDANSLTHTHMTCPFGFDYTQTTTTNGYVSGNILRPPLTSNTAILSDGPYTINAISARPPGALLLVSDQVSSVQQTFQCGAGGSGQILCPTSIRTFTLQTGDSILFWSDGSNWHVMTNRVSLDDQKIRMATKEFAGICSMSGATQCTITVNGSYASRPICIAQSQGSTPLAASCSVAGNTLTITAASSNTQTWGAILIGNQN